jgi:hypothetical protein
MVGVAFIALMVWVALALTDAVDTAPNIRHTNTLG